MFCNICSVRTVLKGLSKLFVPSARLQDGWPWQDLNLWSLHYGIRTRIIQIQPRSNATRCSIPIELHGSRWYSVCLQFCLYYTLYKPVWVLSQNKCPHPCKFLSDILIFLTAKTSRFGNFYLRPTLAVIWLQELTVCSSDRLIVNLLLGWVMITDNHDIGSPDHVLSHGNLFGQVPQDPFAGGCLV